MALAPGPEQLPASSAVLIVLDGWGLEPDGPRNAVSQAGTPCSTSCGRAIRPRT
jgi:bisphosphoglycerate-independent phosphoglycerate mutase (AlkP superfamily)